MPLIAINWNPSTRQLTQFGLLSFFVLPLIGWMTHGGPRVVVALGVIGCICAALSLLIPSALKPVFIAISVMTAPIGIVMSEVALLLIFFCVFVPIGLVLRLFRIDPLRRKFERDSSTYWETKRAPREVASYFRQS